MNRDEWEAMLRAESPDPDVVIRQILRRPKWHRRAACHGQGPADWFPGRGGTQDAARAVCVRCPVREECLAFAMKDPDLQGVWGGLSQRQRRLLRQMDCGTPSTVTSENPSEVPGAMCPTYRPLRPIVGASAGSVPSPPCVVEPQAG